MVEAPRIRIIYDRLKFTKGLTIICASGTSYVKLGIDLTNYLIKKWWFAGKYIYFHVIFEEKPEYVIRTHMLMYGRITVNDIDTGKKPFMTIELNDGTILRWFMSQIILLDPYCSDNEIKSNYTTCNSRQLILDSIKMMRYDLSNRKFNLNLFKKHLKIGIKKYLSDIITDFLLNQEYFPGVGNILQQEALYDCKILPQRIISTISEIEFDCLISSLKKVIDLLYESYVIKLQGKTFGPILRIYHKSLCPLGHKTITKYIGYRNRRTTWCPICQK
ncbi:formamidopyrimidine-DNA glycosylase [Cotonvirus japonicus]|uniref:Formamidopyrimidine-DNA glycosylase n=1 Tax=Cotonvirus japonicus TaxID=2811091 RepID=A0ABM7NRY3_9VIRU|nr:formamidopyrimidine-DNA glycosylase [Cotonvirus japonicus]BCS82914.1 formamidopyrimidine-DNA glycosylase [Cotonvirus japonicus]